MINTNHVNHNILIELKLDMIGIFITEHIMMLIVHLLNRSKVTNLIFSIRILLIKPLLLIIHWQKQIMTSFAWLLLNQDLPMKLFIFFVIYCRIFRLELCIKNGILLIKRGLNAFSQWGFCICILILRNTIIVNEDSL